MKILFVSPHLSTGGLPQYLYWKCKELIEENEIHVIEYSCISRDYTIQRNKIKKLLGENFFSLEGNNKEKIKNFLKILKTVKPDVVHFEEIPETFAPDLLDKVYVEDRDYFIVETSHGSWIGPDVKKYLPDKFVFVTPYQKENYKNLGIPIEILEYPIIKKERPDRTEALNNIKTDSSLKYVLDPEYKHILHVGLFAPHKCQHEIFDIARELEDYKVNFHFIGNRAENFRSYWEPLMNEPASNCYLWGERKDVDKFYAAMDLLIFPSNKETNPLVPKEALSWQMPVFMKNLPVYMGMYDDNELVTTMTDNLEYNSIHIINSLNLKRKGTIGIYDDLKKRKTLNIKPKKTKKATEINVTFINGPKVSIGNGDENKIYNVKFIDNDVGELVYEDNIKTGQWTKCLRQWLTNWRIQIFDNKKMLMEHMFNPIDKKVYIHLDSKSLGDTIAWFPYVEEFRKKYNCNVVCSTFWNQLFEKDYPEIKFVNPGTIIHNLYAQFSIGITQPHNVHRSPLDGFNIPLAKTASDILGINYNFDLKANISVDTERTIKEKYVCIGMHSTAQCKLWNYPDGWQEITDYLIDKGYKVVVIHKEKDGHRGVKIPEGAIDKTGNIDIWDRINDIYHADMFIGLGSGLSWLAHAIGTTTIMIAGHSNPFVEFQENIIRIKGEGDCVGCFSNLKYTFDKGDWNWCPENKNFACSRLIHPNKVKTAINAIEFINKLSIPEGTKYREMVNQYYEIFVNNTYFSDKVYIGGNDSVVDIGANIGMFSNYAALTTDNTVIAFEAEQNNYEALKTNVKNSNVLTHNMIVSDKPGKSKLYIDEYSGGHSIYSSNNLNNSRTSEYQTIITTTVDEIVEKYGEIDFLKIDIEGAEKEIFTSIKDETLKKIKKISLEFHPLTFKDDYNLNDFIKRIKKLFEYEIRKFGYFYIILLNRKENV